jgi:hypothetical protein
LSFVPILNRQRVAEMAVAWPTQRLGCALADPGHYGLAFLAGTARNSLSSWSLSQQHLRPALVVCCRITEGAPVSHHLDPPLLVSPNGQLYIDDRFVFSGKGGTASVMDVKSTMHRQISLADCLEAWWNVVNRPRVVQQLPAAGPRRAAGV